MASRAPAMSPSRYLASDAGRADDESLVVAFEVGAVGAWTHVVAVDPRAGDELDEVLIALVVLCA